MSNLGRAMVGGKSLARKTGRMKDDFYPTPKECTIALMRAEDQYMPAHVWEPACGDGAIATIIGGHNRKVESTDLVNRGYGSGGRNFLFELDLIAPAIVTNPPFSLAAPFIKKAHELGAEYIALLLKSTFWHAANRTGLFFRYPPARIYALTWRPDFLEQNAPTMDCMWCVWDQKAKTDTTEYHLMRHPHTADKTYGRLV
jgi:hypothetical protein